MIYGNECTNERREIGRMDGREQGKGEVEVFLGTIDAFYLGRYGKLGTYSTYLDSTTETNETREKGWKKGWMEGGERVLFFFK